MKTNIIPLNEIYNYQAALGNKTLSLKRCVDLGFNVPKFIALPSSVSKILLSDEIAREKTVTETINMLPGKKYAVRSSALGEDNKNCSLAGQFLTKTNIDKKHLSQSIYEALKQAETYLNGNLDKFSIIVQEYISPDIAGVAFTRNPNGQREMIIEYDFCEGEKIVSGKIKPHKISLFWHNVLPKKTPRSFFTNQIIKKFKEIEKTNNFPQDIEWCISNNKFYLLQTRPITTISDKQYKQVLFLEKALEKYKKYYFEKTKISETAPRPSTITLDVLHFIYSKNGPVDKVYKKYKVNYEDTKFLKIIGNELYVNKEKEIQGLLPSYSYLNNKNFFPKFNKFSNISISLKNLFFLNKIKTTNYEKLFYELKTKIEEKESELNLKTAIKKFLTEYELIFEINLLSGLSIKKINLLLNKEAINFSETIDSQSLFVDLNKYSVHCPINLQGNSLEISDESIFTTSLNIKNNNTDKVKLWWRKTSPIKKKILQEKITEAIVYNHLRELGRWLTVKNNNLLKKRLLEYAKNNNFKNIKNIFFSPLDDVLNKTISESVCDKNKNNYTKYNHFNFPNKLTSSIINKKNKTLGVSSGLAAGVLETKESINKKSIKNEKIILYTETLTPDLIVYFDKISGIISSNGGLLSHLAIIAREKNIPVVVGFSLVDSDLKIGDKTKIDGGSGKILKLEN